MELNYHHLRYFHAVAHEGHLGRAAARLNLSQSALSVQIRTLEDRLGHALFERVGRRLVLTEAGRIALDHADAIFRSGEELVATLNGRGAARERLRIGALATLSRNFVIGFLAPVLGRADLEVAVLSGGSAALLEALDRLDLDIVLTNRPPLGEGPSPFVAHRLAEQPVSLVGTPGRLGHERDVGRLLARHPVVVPTDEAGVRAGFDALAARLGVSLRIAAEADDMAMLRLLARADAGLAVLPTIVVQDELSSGMLVEVERLAGINETFYAVTAERRFPKPAVGALIAAATLERAAEAEQAP